MSKGGDAPDPDPQIGQAALRSAQLGEDYLAYMQKQAKVTNRWAQQDRRRSRTVFQPLEDRFIAEAEAYDTPERREAAAREAAADVQQGFAEARDQRMRSEAAMGVNPAAGRAGEMRRRDANAQGLAVAGAENLSRRQTEATGRALRGGAIDMGKGLSVNPATSMSLSNGAVSGGFSGAMSGQNQKAGILGNVHQMKMQGWQQNQQMIGDTIGAVGMLGGAIFSSKDYKTDKGRPEMSALEAMKRMPVEEWRYKPGVGDGGAESHVGPYAEDFRAATGKGDGRTIPVVDALGVTMGAIKELSAKVERLEGGRRQA